MFMKRIEIKNLNDFFSTLKLNAFSKETRSSIIKNHIKLNKIVNETEELTKEIYTKLVTENEDAVKKLNEKRELYKIASDEDKPTFLQAIINECQDGLKVEMELNELIRDLNNEEINLDLIKFDLETFVDECADAGLDFTLTDFDNINVIFN